MDLNRCQSSSNESGNERFVDKIVVGSKGQTKGKSCSNIILQRSTVRRYLSQSQSQLTPTVTVPQAATFITSVNGTRATKPKRLDSFHNQQKEVEKRPELKGNPKVAPAADSDSQKKSST